MSNNASGNEFIRAIQANRPEPINIADMPVFANAKKKDFQPDPDKYVVRYFKADTCNLEDMAMLESIETKGLKGEEVVILSRDTYSFMQQYFVLLRYLEYQG